MAAAPKGCGPAAAAPRGCGPAAAAPKGCGPAAAAPKGCGPAAAAPKDCAGSKKRPGEAEKGVGRRQRPQKIVQAARNALERPAEVPQAQDCTESIVLDSVQAVDSRRTKLLKDFSRTAVALVLHTR